MEEKIIKQCQDLGTYQDAYIPAIETLAGILEQRDRTCGIYKIRREIRGRIRQ